MKYYIGIDLGGTNVRTLLVGENGTVYAEVKDNTERENGPDYVCTKIIKQIEALDTPGFNDPNLYPLFLTIIFPISPACPRPPEINLPSAIKAPPIPVEIVT